MNSPLSLVALEEVADVTMGQSPDAVKLPTIGAFIYKTSNHWNFFLRIFQWLELSSGIFPIVGNS
ncbi:MAG: hypothetical protein EOL87_07645 [Spartobacteria bacterium]|nr:hypothetical protein [Spartobacteria bacterium]